MPLDNTVFQGSVLGPRLFNINVRSQPQVFQSCSFGTSSFADDSNGRCTFALSFQFQVIKNDVASCMEKIINWSHAHFMKINPDKTELLLLYPPTLCKEVKIKGVLLGDQCIRFSEKVKNVGVTIDCNLTMDKHVNSVVSHCYKILEDIGRIKKHLNTVIFQLQAVSPEPVFITADESPTNSNSNTTLPIFNGINFS